MGIASNYVIEVEKLYEFSKRFNEAKDRSRNVNDYEGILMVMKRGRVKAKQLAVQVNPRFFKLFCGLAVQTLTMQFYLIEEDEPRVSSVSPSF